MVGAKNVRSVALTISLIDCLVRGNLSWGDSPLVERPLACARSGNYAKFERLLMCNSTRSILSPVGIKVDEG